MQENIGIIKDIITILVLAVGGLLAVFIYVQFAPTFTLRIIPRWMGENDDYFIVKFEVENSSRVRVNRPGRRYQVLKHQTQPGASIFTLGPFAEGRIKSGEERLEWVEPIEIFGSTRQIYPGEKVSAEKLYDCPASDGAIVYLLDCR